MARDESTIVLMSRSSLPHCKGMRGRVKAGTRGHGRGGRGWTGEARRPKYLTVELQPEREAGELVAVTRYTYRRLEQLLRRALQGVILLA